MKRMMKSLVSKRSVGWGVCVWCIVSMVSCSSIPGFRPSSSEAESAGQKLYLKVTPEEAIEILQEVAPEHGWEVKAVGEQYDLTGPRGKYFRVEADKLIGGKSEMSGVFFSDPKGAYVLIGKREMGLPEALVEPVKAEVRQRAGE